MERKKSGDKEREKRREDKVGKESSGGSLEDDRRQWEGVGRKESRKDEGGGEDGSTLTSH